MINIALLAGVMDYINCRGVPHPNECPEHDTKQSDGEVPVMLDLGGMQSTFSLPSLQSAL